jgi:hypothetical protein
MRRVALGLLASLLVLAAAPLARAQATAAPSPADLEALAAREAAADSAILIQEKQLQLQLDRQKVAIAHEVDRHEIFTLYKQSVFGVLITILVLSITTGGVVMSYLQFRADLKAERSGPPITFKAGAGGVEISSSVIGLVILAVSTAFFYLYVKEVYPVTVVGAPQLVQVAPATDPKAQN